MNTKHIQTSDTLSWIKSELDDLVDSASNELVLYIEENQDPSLLKRVKEILLQLRSTLEAVEIFGASMLAREVSELVDALLNDTVENKQDAYELLLQAMLMFPDYLEHVQQNNNEVPLVLLPYLNDLRTVRNSEPFSAQVLFFPDLKAVKVPVPDDRIPSEDLRVLAKQLRYTYQLGLLGWFRGKDVDINLQKMQKVINHLYRAAQTDASRRLWWVVAAVLQALSTGGLAPSVTIKTLLGKVDRQLKFLIDHDERLFSERLPGELINNLLYYLAVAKDSGDLVKEIREAYALSKLLPDETSLESIRQSIFSPNSGLWHTVAKAICEDLADVKDNLEIFVSDNEKNPEFLEKINNKLHQISSTLAMLGLMEPHKKVLEYTEIVRRGIEGKTEITENTVLSMASMVLELESLILNFASSREKIVEPNESDTSSSVSKDSSPGVSEFENSRLLEAVVSESKKEIEKVKDRLLEYVESPNDETQLAVPPQCLETVRGALLVAGMETASGLTKSISRYISHVFLEQKRVPDGPEFEKLAETITNLEYYLEAKLKGADDALSYLNNGIEVFDSLGLAVNNNVTTASAAEADSHMPEASENLTVIDQATAEPENETGSPMEEQPLDLSGQSVDEANEQESATILSNSLESEQENAKKIPVLSGDVDAEILEIFLEEAKEELENISQMLPVWQRNSDNYDTLAEIRRAFHTLKGSGRLVGADLLGEFAWAFEDMLNRVLEKTVPVTAELSDLLGGAVKLLPQLIGQLQGQNLSDMDPYPIMNRTRALIQKGCKDVRSSEDARKVS